MARLLVVDDEQSICWGLARLGEKLGHEVATASSAEEALETAGTFLPEVVVLDVRLPGMDGLTAISKIRERAGQIPIIIVTAYGDLKTAVEAVRNGAFEYLVKPFELTTVEAAIHRALSQQNVVNSGTASAIPTGGLVGNSAALQEVFKRIALAAASDAGVLLFGESGTGKELAARAIHKYSDRADRPYVAVNVASLSATLAESELFGHVRGAFTGADQDRVGLLAQANGGTLFLDEVADIPLPVQVKLLRVLEHGEVIPVGATSPVKTDFRVVSATHQNLLQQVQEGSFRHDLYFRLGAFRIDIPPLRERREDIEELALYFLNSMKGQRGTPPVVSQDALNELRGRPWYGNVRELRNALEHAVMVARGGVIELEHLPKAVPAALLADGEQEPAIDDAIVALIRRWAETRISTSTDTDSIHDELLQLVEPPLLQVAIDAHHGQCAAAARSLGLHRTTLRKKLDLYGISEE